MTRRICACHGCAGCAGGPCHELVDAGRCGDCRRTARRAVDARRLSASERGYGYRWQVTRQAYLAEHPVCECDDQACIEPATDVDHVDGRGPLGPRGHDPSNLRAMAHACHARRTARDQPAGWNTP